MNTDSTATQQSTALPPAVEALLAAVAAVRDEPFWTLGGDRLLDVARAVEQADRMLYAAQVRIADEVNAQCLAQVKGCPSSAALLRQALNISAGEAAGRLRAGQALLAQDLPSGGEAPIVLPAAACAIDDGLKGADHLRTILGTMRRLPDRLDGEKRVLAEKTLVEAAIVSDPRQLDAIATHLEEIIDPDGRPDPDEAAAKMELHIGRRNPSNGLTPITGRLDDAGVAVLKVAIDGLSAPEPDTGGGKDTRSAATRLAHAVIEALRRGLDAGVGPTNGKEKPHLVLTIEWDVLRKAFGAASYADGGPVSPSEVRRLACEAGILPVVLDGKAKYWTWAGVNGPFRRTYDEP